MRYRQVFITLRHVGKSLHLHGRQHLEFEFAFDDEHIYLHMCIYAFMCILPFQKQLIKRLRIYYFLCLRISEHRTWLLPLTMRWQSQLNVRSEIIQAINALKRAKVAVLDSLLAKLFIAPPTATVELLLALIRKSLEFRRGLGRMG